MLNTISINLKTDIKTDRPTTLPIKLMSQDKNNNQFILRFTNGGESVTLDDSYTVEVLTKFTKSGTSRLTAAKVRQDYATWEFDTAYITRDEGVRNYVYVRKSGNLVVSADANCFVFNVGLSEIDKGAGKVAETYDENYEKVLHEFEVGINLTKEEWVQMGDATRDFVDDIKDRTVDEFVELKMGEELQNLETNYATRLTDLETNDASITAQLAQTMTKLDKPVINMKEYPRLVGETDDTARINRAITALGKKAGYIDFPDTLYTISDSIKYQASGQKLRSCSPNGTTVRLTVSGTALKIDGSVNFMTSTLARVGFENLLFELMEPNSIGLDFRGINYAKFEGVIVVRGINSKAVWATSESGLNGYYNDFSKLDLSCTATPALSTNTVGYSFVNNPNATNMTGSNRRAPNANKVDSGRVSGFHIGYEDVGIGNFINGTKFESNYYDLVLGSDDETIFNPGTTNHTVIIGTYHEGGTTMETVLTIKKSASRVTWLPSNVTAYRKMYEDNGTRSNILFFGSGVSSRPAKMLGYILMEYLTLKELNMADSVTSTKISMKNSVNANGKDIWQQNVSHSHASQAWRLYNNTDNKIMAEVGTVGSAKFYAGVSGGAFTTATRPTLTQAGTMVFDTDLGKPIWYTGAVWKDATGTTV